MLRNTIQCVSHLPTTHILNNMAAAPVALPVPGCHPAQCPPLDNIWLLKGMVTKLPPLALHDPVTQVGNRLLDNTSHISVNIPSAPARMLKVFHQWVASWMHQCELNLANKTAIGMDGSYQIKGKALAPLWYNVQVSPFTCTVIWWHILHMMPKCRRLTLPSTMSCIILLGQSWFSLTTNPP